MKSSVVILRPACPAYRQAGDRQACSGNPDAVPSKLVLEGCNRGEGNHKNELDSHLHGKPWIPHQVRNDNGNPVASYRELTSLITGSHQTGMYAMKAENRQVNPNKLSTI
jgi:hypothetical protein